MGSIGRKPLEPQDVRLAGACDCHLHVFGPHAAYPLAAGRSYTPEVATLDDYLAPAAAAGLDRMVIVQPSVYGYDNSCTRNALVAAGLGRARGIAALSPATAASDIEDLHALGFRGVRFITHASGGASLDDLRAIAGKIAPFGWHVQMYVPGSTWCELLPTLLDLPVDIVIDHLGTMADVADDDAGLRAIRTLLDGGRGWIKPILYRASRGAYPYADTQGLLNDFATRAPDRCLWGSDWPHPLMTEVPAISQVQEAALSGLTSSTRRRILVENPARLYGFESA